MSRDGTWPPKGDRRRWELRQVGVTRRTWPMRFYSFAEAVRMRQAGGPGWLIHDRRALVDLDLGMERFLVEQGGPVHDR